MGIAASAAPGLVVTAFVAGFVFGGIFETHSVRGAGLYGLFFLVMAVACGFILVEHGPIRPLWLQYLLLGGVPLLLGLLARWALGRRGAEHPDALAQNNEDDS